MNKKNLLLGAIITILAISLVQLYNINQNNDLNPISSTEFIKLSSESDLLNIFSNTYGPIYRTGENLLTMDVAMPTAETSARSTEATTDFSQTNVQVQGIDEADLLKTDGEYVYTISSKNLFIIKAYPHTDLNITTKIEFENDPTHLFIDEDKLVVFGRVTQDTSILNLPRAQYSFIKVYDMEDKQNLVLLEEYMLPGFFQEARLKEGVIYSINNVGFSFNSIMPRLAVGDNIISIDSGNMYAFNLRYQNPRLTLISTLDLNNLDINTHTFVTEYNQNVYMSHSNIYLTHTYHLDETDIMFNILKTELDSYLSSQQRTLISEIEQTSDMVLSEREKRDRIMNVYMQVLTLMPYEEHEVLEKEIESQLNKELEKYKHTVFTHIAKIGYDKGTLTPKATGSVYGTLLNQFSMDESRNNEVFRLATTTPRNWDSKTRNWEPSFNHVFTLDKNLNVLDKLEDLAEDERIYSARFVDDMLYMVTFREIDPFFVIDLSNPKNIQNLGELKIPGFSTYLHPYDETTIIGIGQEADEQGRIQGLKISLFDVSDYSNPIEIAKYVGDDRYARSTALYEHKAFLFNKERNLLVLPIVNNDWQNQDNQYNGALVFNITRNNIELRGLIDHSGSTRASEQAQTTDGRAIMPRPHMVSQGVERSFYIEDLLYTKSHNLLRINKINTLQAVGDLDLSTSPNMPVY